VRFQAASSLVEVDAGRAYTPLVQALGDEDAEVIGAAALGLGAIGDRRAAGHLSRFLDHPRDETRFDAAYGLARLSDARAVAPLASFLEHPQHAWDAIEGLEMTGSPAAAAALAPLLERRFVARRLRLRAAGALLALDADHRLAGRARQLIVTGLGAWRLEHRALAVVLAGQVGQTWALAPLRALRQSRRGRFLREEIDEALAQLTALCQATSA
jgi:HEAT repeat protein